MKLIERGIVLGIFVIGFITIGGWSLVHAADGDTEVTEVPATNPLSGNQAAIDEGRSWYRSVCSNCHGGRADGAGERGSGADLRAFNKGFKKFVETVKNGRDTGRAMKMPRWGKILTEDTIYKIGAYLETLAIEGSNWKEGVK
jgi:mono/diheme cytochrome c family protein